jgi:hypothetical protein
VDVRRALLDRLRDDLVRELDDRRVVDRLAQVDDLGVRLLVLGAADRVRDDLLHPPHAGDERAEVLAAGDRGADLQARHDREVVHRDDVGGIGHRDEQRALAGVGDRHGVVAPGGGDGDEARGGHVDLEGGEVDVLEAMALCERAGEVVGAQDAGRDELGLGRRPRGPRRGDRRLDARGVAEAEVDDDVGQEARAAGARARLRDAVPAVALGAREAHVGEPGDAGGGLAAVGIVVGVRAQGQDGSATALRIARRSGVTPVHACNERAPWRTSTSSPPTTAVPRSRAASSSAVPPGR